MYITPDQLKAATSAARERYAREDLADDVQRWSEAVTAAFEEIALTVRPPHEHEIPPRGQPAEEYARERRLDEMAKQPRIMCGNTLPSRWGRQTHDNIRVHFTAPSYYQADMTWEELLELAGQEAGGWDPGPLREKVTKSGYAFAVNVEADGALSERLLDIGVLTDSGSVVVTQIDAVRP